MDGDVQVLVRAIRTTLPAEWGAWSGGWPGEIEAALADAVLSIRARYGQEHNGVRGAITRWRVHRGDVLLDDLRALVTADSATLSEVFGSQRLSGGLLKSAAIQQAAANLTNVGVRRAADVDPHMIGHQSAYTVVPGLGDVTWSYFLMLLGYPGVKADVWIRRFVGEALGGRMVTAREARDLVSGAAGELEVTPSELDHAIWSHWRRRGR